MSAQSAQQEGYASLRVDGEEEAEDEGIAWKSEEQKELFQKLLTGVSATKFGRRGKPQAREFKITEDMHLVWRSKWKSSRKTQIDLSSVSRVQPGQQTQKFARHKDKFRESSTRSFSIIYDGQTSSLDLVCDTEEEQQLWVATLESLIKHSQSDKQLLDPEAAYFKRQWKKADADGSGTLDVAEVIQLVQKLNINTDRKYIKAKIREVDENDDKVLQFDEFVELMRLLRARDELEVLFFSLLPPAAAGAAAASNGSGGGGGSAAGPSGQPEAVFSAVAAATPVPGKLTAEQRKRIRHENVSRERFQQFLGEEQGEGLSEEQATALLMELDPEGQGSVLSYRAFYSYMAGPANEAFNPAKGREVYQDMEHPLSHYFIASSHNTYLEGDQLQSSSSVNRYINDLCKGCRCVEIDCWDGDDGEPVVFHGHTLTGKIRFKDVIQAVKDYSFLNSPYPVILSLENHCSLPQQQVMATYLTNTLGEHLSVPPAEMDLLPSPESLRNKVILKGKIVQDANQLVDEDESDEDAMEALEDAGVADPTAAPAVVGTVSQRIAAEPSMQFQVDASTSQQEREVSNASADADGERRGSDSAALAGTGASGSLRAKSHRRGKSSRGSFSSTASAGSAGSGGTGTGGDAAGSSGGGKKEHKHKVAMELSRITFLGGAKFKGWDAARQNPVNAMSSFSETKTAKLLAKHAASWVHYNQRQMSRIYPTGARVDSSNYDPVPSWTVGSQIVALNYQTPSVPMRHNDGKFRDNGGCGYVLKPWFLRDPDTVFAPEQPKASGMDDMSTLVVRVISAQQLPKPGGAERGEIIDPYVQVSIAGLPADTTKKPKLTRTIQDNGFNPVWEERFEFQFTAAAAELGLLNLTVMDKDVDADDFIAYAVIPLHCLRPGYRSVALFSGNGTRHGEFEHCTLFCHFAFREG